MRRGYVADERDVFVREYDDGVADVEFDHDEKVAGCSRPSLVWPRSQHLLVRGLEAGTGSLASLGERATELVRGYKRDLDRNRPALRELQQELAIRTYL